MDLSDEPKLIQDLWHIIDQDVYAWLPVWGEPRCGKTTICLLSMYKVYKDWDDVLAAIVFNLNQFIYKLRKGEPRLFPTRTKPCHMRVPILLIDDFASSCGKAKTQHEKSWDVVKGSWDVLGTRVGVIFASMVEPTSPTQQLLLKYTHEIKVERLADNTRIYKYDRCNREQDFRGWKTRQKKDWLETQEFGQVPLDVYKQYDEMRMSLVDEVLVSITDTMVDDTLSSVIRRLEPIDIQLMEFIKLKGPINYHSIYETVGRKKGKNAMSRCKARGLVVPKRQKGHHYIYDLTDFGYEVLKELEKPKEEPHGKLLKPLKIVT